MLAHACLVKGRFLPASRFMHPPAFSGLPALTPPLIQPAKDFTINNARLLPSYHGTCSAASTTQRMTFCRGETLRQFRHLFRGSRLKGKNPQTLNPPPVLPRKKGSFSKRKNPQTLNPLAQFLLCAA